jgi:hypothetical protein
VEFTTRIIGGDDKRPLMHYERAKKKGGVASAP